MNANDKFDNKNNVLIPNKIYLLFVLILGLSALVFLFYSFTFHFNFINQMKSGYKELIFGILIYGFLVFTGIALVMKLSNDYTAIMTDNLISRKSLTNLVTLSWNEIKRIEIASGITIKDRNNKKIIISIYAYSNSNEILKFIFEKAKIHKIEIWK